MTCTIYTLVDPRNGATRYIGCTAKPLLGRLRHYLARRHKMGGPGRLIPGQTKQPPCYR